jgi:hypothetical protein
MNIEYESQCGGPKSDDSRPSQRGALLLCAPGALSLMLLFTDRSLIGQLPSGIAELIGTIFWPLVLIAVTTALCSLYTYIRMPRKPWFVIVNLTINGFGLLLFLFAIVG